MDENRIPHILNSLKVFSCGKVCGVESLDHLSDDSNHADIPAEVRHSYGLRPLALVNWIEDARDLIADCASKIRQIWGKNMRFYKPV